MESGEKVSHSQPELLKPRGHARVSRRSPGWLFPCLLVLLVFVQACSAVPPSFARLDLNQTQDFRNMSVSSLETIDLMNLSLTQVTLHSTSGDGTDIKNLSLPSVRNIHRVFSNDTATWQGNTLTILGGTDSTVPGSGMTFYSLFILPHLPVFRCQIPGVSGDVLFVKGNATTRNQDISSLIQSTERAYLMHDPRGVLAIEQPPLSIGVYGSWSHPADYNESDFGFTFLHNEFPVTDWTLNPTYAKWVSDLAPPITGNPPIPGEYLLSVFQYGPSQQKITTYAAWPVIIMNGDNTLDLIGETPPYLYNKRSGGDLDLTFINTTQVNNLSYVLIKDGETYDAEVRVNMTALEESGGAVSLDLILSGNPFLSILRNTGLGSEDLKKVVSYSIRDIDNGTSPHSSDICKINITPGYGTSGYALHAIQVTIPHDDLQWLISGNFSIYALGADSSNTVVALDHDVISVGNSPLADFSATPTTGPAPLLVQFSDLSTDDPTWWAWDFGDGTGNGSVKNPGHTYANAGLYNVTLTASNAFGSDTARKDFSINVTPPVPPVANFSGTPTTGPAPLTVQFTESSTGTITSRAWTFGDSGTSTAVNPSHTYTTAGTYTVSLNVTGPGGSDTETRVNYITVTPPALQADFTGSPTAGFVPHFVQFTDTSTGAHDTWNWNFGDGGTSASQNPGHTYTSTGTFTVSLTVRMGSGTPSTRTRTNYITVYSVPPGPVAQFTANVTSGDAPLPVQFTDLSTGSPYEWNWSFGNGGSSTGRNPVQTYTSPGNYTVSLTVRGLGGYDTETKTGYIHVLAHPPVADFSANVTSGDAPLPVRFTDLSTGDPTIWSWTFGDGGSSTLQHPVHVYLYAGNYTVSLTTGNAQGTDTKVRTGYINVTGISPPPPVFRADFAAAPTAGFVPLTVLFADTSTGNPVSWNWTFGDGGSSTLQHPVHVYNDVGAFSVSLTVSNGTADDTLTRPDYIIVSRRGGGGGGGGGGGSGVFLVTATPTPTATFTPTPTPSSMGTLPLGPDNRTTQPVTIGSYDGIATLSIGAGVAVTCDGGTPIRDIGISPVPEGGLPDLPVEPVYMGYAYNVTPQCAAFDPEVLLTFSFTPEEWNALAGRDLVLMWFDPAAGTWTHLPTSVDNAGRTVITGISRGGIYGLFARSPVTTPVQTGVPATPVTPAEPPLPWTWILLVVVVVVVVAGAAVYLLKIRTGARKPPGGDENPGG
ncbi:MAG: PKD domain-containing protein [Methanolinea sp.]|nr:PKD domain-containing protein [Methanolinea sp.]